MKKTQPLSGQGKEIRYWVDENTIRVEWGRQYFLLSHENINVILRNFFVDTGQWYPLGASVTETPHDGLGHFVNNAMSGLTPRHASAFAAILVNEGYLDHRGVRRIELKRISQS